MTLPTMLPHSRAQTLAWCREVDDGPWASLAVPERITYTSHDWTTDLAAAAALTERVRLWTTIVILPAHDEVAVAKALASVDVLSDGRLTVGVGVGGREHDYRAIGGTFTRRWQRMDEQVARMRRVWAGEPPFEGADPVGPAPVQGASMPVIAGVMGPKAIARAAHWADGVDGAWTMDGDRDAMAAAFAQIRGAWEAAGRTEAPHLSSSIWYALGDGAEARLRDYAHTYMRIMGDAVGDWAAGSVTCFTRDALNAAVDTRARCRRRRVLPGADDVGSRRARAHAGCPRHLMDVDGLLEEVSAAVALDDYGDPTFRDGLDALVGVGHQGSRPQRDRHDGARSTGADVPGQPAAGPRVAPHPSGLGHHSGGGTADPGRHAPQRHHRVEPPARGRSRQPLAARLGGQRVGAAAEPLDLPRRPALRRRPRRPQRRPPDQPRVQGDPPRRARRRDGVHRRARAALPEPHLLDHVQPAELRRMAARVRLARRHRSPPPRVAGAAVGVPGALAAEVTSVRVAARRAARDLSRRAAGRHPS